MERLTNSAEAGWLICGKRHELGMTQTQLAERAGVSRKFVAAFEAGHERAELGKFMQLAAAVRCTILASASSSTVSDGWNLDDTALQIRRNLKAGGPGIRPAHSR